MSKPALKNSPSSRDGMLQAEACYEYLRRHLLHRQLPAGSRLVEEKWASIIGVNRSAVREALHLLAHEGLLKPGPRGGFFVPQLDRQAIDEVLEVRLALEVGALKMFQLRKDLIEPDFSRLRETCDVMQRMLNSGFEYGFVEADVHFHELIVELSHNPRMIRVYRQAALPISPLPEVDESTRRANMAATVADHVKLCDLLESGNVPEAISLLERHLMVSHQLVSNQSATPSKTKPSNGSR